MTPNPSGPRALERRVPLPAVLAWRYLRGERSQILSSTALAALVATGLGVFAMVIALALMSGYTHDLKRKLLGLQGDVIASPLDAAALVDGRDRLDAARSDGRLAGVSFVGRVAYGEGSISSPATGTSDSLAVILRGIEAGSAPPLLDADGRPDPHAPPVDLHPDERGVAGVLLGKELARQLAVEPGDAVRLVVLRAGERRIGFRYRSARLAGTFTTGFHEFDSSWVLLDRDVLEAVRGDTGLDVLELRLAADIDRDAETDTIREVLGQSWSVQRWETLNRGLFDALALQEAMLFLVLGLIVVVSTFNTVSTLIILVRERTSDLGVLATLGLRPRQIRSIFVLYGLGLGTVGTAFGIAAGAGVAWVITTFELIRFDPEVAAIYFIDAVPFRVEPWDLVAVIAFSLTVTFLACSLPARRAARLRPADALRDE
ncbi:MAG: FtsX-like permease family protein [Acidobacteriota bacterium]